MQIVTVKSWPLDLRSTSEMKPRFVGYKNASNACCRIGIRRFRYCFRRFNLCRYNSFHKRLRLNRLENDSPTNQDAPRTPCLSEDQGSRFSRPIGRPRIRHVKPIFDHRSRSIGRSRLRHVICSLIIIQTINFRLEKSVCNSKKS